MKRLDYIMPREDFSILENYNHINEAIFEGQELSAKQIAYQELMFFGLAKFGAETPADLTDDKKSEFFNWIRDNWDKKAGKVKNKEVADNIKKAKEKKLIDDPENATAKNKGKEAEKKAEQFKKELED